MSYIIKKFLEIVLVRVKHIIFSYIFLHLFLFAGGCSSPIPSGEEYSEIDVLGDPVQVSEKGDPMLKGEKDCTYTIKPVARYKISAIVVGKKSYPFGCKAKVSPVDLALAWGKLAEPESENYITYGQSDRWYFYEYKPNSPVKNFYIIRHSSNNHIIPANDNILKAIKTIKKKEKIILEGQLVDVNGSHKGRAFWWNSSITRSDTGDGSCEVFYVTKVRIGDKVYE